MIDIRIKINSCLRCGIIGLLLVFVIQIPPLFAQESVDSLATEEETLPEWDESTRVELETIQIEGKIVQPNVIITVSRQEPQFKEITFEWTPAGNLIDLDLTRQGKKTLEAVRIDNWGELLDRPRE